MALGVVLGGLPYFAGVVYFFAVVVTFVLVFGRSMSWYSLVWVVERGVVAFGSVITTELLEIRLSAKLSLHFFELNN